jgi:peptidoglycan hydrolase CwlO-like protein
VYSFVGSIDQDKTLQDNFSYKEEVTRFQSQVNHLTSLLRESEANCDRLTQLSEALKEEIRRIERDVERQAHLKENTEYLKNVILKVFLAKLVYTI